MSASEQASAPLVEIANVRVERNGVTLIDIPALSIQRSENIVIFGPNGSGKSSLLKLFMKLYYPSASPAASPSADGAREGAGDTVAGQGTVRILGSDDWNVWELRKHLGFVSSEIDHHFMAGRSGRLNPLNAVLTGFESGELELAPESITPERIEQAKEWLEFFGVSAESTKHVGWLSTGERRRVMLARAMVLNPDAILLDEPTAGLDLVTSHRLLALLDKIMLRGIQLILVTHHLEEVLPSFERVVALQAGRIRFDSRPEDIFSSENLTELFQAPIVVEQSASGWKARLR